MLKQNKSFINTYPYISTFITKMSTSYKHIFSRFVAEAGEKLHFCAHSHHYWPDATREAQLEYWEDTCRLVDDKWGRVFGHVMPEAQSHIARILNLKHANQIAFASNTHELLTRLLSTFPVDKPVRILSSNNEFHSFKRQVSRLEEDNLVECTKLDSGLLATDRAGFIATIIAELNGAKPYDLFFMSQVFFDSGLVLTTADFEEIVSKTPSSTLVCIDGYHSFMAIPLDLSALEDRVFYLSGGYKYAMSGEGNCFMVVPRGDWRPAYTGWFAEMGNLTKARGSLTSYSNDGGAFLGATMDFSSMYRFNAAMKALQANDISVNLIHDRVAALQADFLSKIPGPAALPEYFRLVNTDGANRGHFLTFETGSEGRIQELHLALKSRGVQTDYRGTRLRFGFAIYHDPADVEKLSSIVCEVLEAMTAKQ
jgi:selenocysteine lyase/cysteine desulfurase